MEEAELISIVVPMYNEEGNVRPLYEAIVKEFDELWCTFELIFVDDGSRDESVATVKTLHDADSRVKLVRLSRNFGCQMAIFAGLEHATGHAVIVMDADLQHPPEIIGRMIELWKEGFEVVYTIREETEGIGFFKRLTSSAFSRLQRRLGATTLEPNVSDYRLMDQRVVKLIVAMRERKRFFRSMVEWVGFRQTGIPFVAAERFSGNTKYSYTKLIGLALDAVTSFSTLPLRLCTYVGFIAAVSVVPYALWAIYVRLFTEDSVHGWSSIIVAVLFLGGVQLISLGILGEYVGRIYEEVKGRPLYITSETCGLCDSTNSPPDNRKATTATTQEVSKQNTASETLARN
ncbi:hypothetical protein CA54_14510 [Symmachiella macrocystis]|uniref:Glycosyltransferase 2-like domain-containing protein n=1 Tax=Symmachiella macrocystis TaxID=2527985 RepID=A0A5C6BLS7_9PLAN|nr:glycosyltransferase family 2 protein [Symmachiella macrocystis]TWU12627.1 hypothetical protein CA54_14510 [Symmachiella macrocystis]